MSRNDDVAAATEKPYAGVVDEIPTRPFEAMLKNEAPVEVATARRLVVAPAVPCTVKSDIGVDDPIPTFPFARTLKNDVLVDEATLKISLVEPATPRTLKVTVDDVALTPSTVPLSIRVDVPRVVAVSQRVA